MVLLSQLRGSLSSKLELDSWDTICIIVLLPPIKRSLEFTNKFPNKIIDKAQLQRLLGSLNYVLDFYPNINRITTSLYDRLKKNSIP